MRSLAILILVILAGPAAAQALKGFDTNAPVDFAADRIEVQDRAGRVMISGNATVRQSSLTLNAARMTVSYIGGVTGSPSVQRIDASGGVTVRSPTETASGAIAIYDVSRRLITMIGGVTLTQGANRVNGARLVIDLTSGRSVIDGGATGGSAGGGRVTGRFTVPQRN